MSCKYHQNDKYSVSLRDKCQAINPSESVDESFERKYCLATNHITCPRFIAKQQEKIENEREKAIQDKESAAFFEAERESYRRASTSNNVDCINELWRNHKQIVFTIRDHYGESGPIIVEIAAIIDSIEDINLKNLLKNRLEKLGDTRSGLVTELKKHSDEAHKILKKHGFSEA